MVKRIEIYIVKIARNDRWMIHLNQIAAENLPEQVHAALAACHAYGRLLIPEKKTMFISKCPGENTCLDLCRKWCGGQAYGCLQFLLKMTFHCIGSLSIPEARSGTG